MWYGFEERRNVERQGICSMGLVREYTWNRFEEGREGGTMYHGFEEVEDLWIIVLNFKALTFNLLSWMLHKLARFHLRLRLL